MAVELSVEGSGGGSGEVSLRGTPATALVFPKFRYALLTGAIPQSLATADLKVVLAKSPYWCNPANDEFLSDVVEAARGGISPALTGKTFTGGVCDAEDLVFGAVAAGDECDYMLTVVDTGDAATSPLVSYAPGLGYTPTGKTPRFTWGAGGLWSLAIEASPQVSDWVFTTTGDTIGNSSETVELGLGENTYNTQFGMLWWRSDAQTWVITSNPWSGIGEFPVGDYCSFYGGTDVTNPRGSYTPGKAYQPTQDTAVLTGTDEGAPAFAVGRATLYPKLLEALCLKAVTGGVAAQTLKAVLLTSAYTYSATHQWLSDVGAGTRVATSEVFTGVTVTTDGKILADAARVGSFTGDAVTKVVVYAEGATEGASRLVSYHEVAGYTPSGVPVVLSWSAEGVAELTELVAV